MTAPVADSSAPQPDGGLRPGVLKVRHAVISALAVITPVAAIVYLFIKNVSPKPPYPADLAIWISIGWLVVGILAMFGLMIFKPGRLSEAAAIIGEGDTPQERGLLDA